MPENCTTTCPALDETTQGAKLTVTGNEFSPNGEDCIHGIPVGDEVTLNYPSIPVYDPPAGPLDSKLNLKDWTDDNPVLVGGAFALYESPSSIPNVLTNAGGSLTVTNAPVVSQPTSAIFVSQRGFIPNPRSDSPYFLASEIPDYDSASFSFQGNDYAFSSLEYSTLGARRIVRICDGQESCNIELIKASSGEVDEENEIIEIDAPDEMLWWGSAEGDDGLIYGMPTSFAEVLIFNPVSKTASLSLMGGSLSGVAETRGAIKAPNGKIYSVPGSATTISIIDPGAGTITRTNMGASLTGAFKWEGGVLTPDGKIYCIPDDATNFLIIDTINETATRTNLGLSIPINNFWYGGALAANGKIYCPPVDGSNILIIDTINNSASLSNMGATLSGSGKWSGAVLGNDGKIYGVPLDATDILIIDPIANTATRSNMGASLMGNEKWRSGILGDDGKIYCAPFDAEDVLVIDPTTQTAIRSDFGFDLVGENKFTSIVKRSNGKLYFMPYTTREIMVINT